jgi:hypothetical protein
MSRKHTRTAQELENELHVQVNLMRTSGLLFDNGLDWEAKRIASTIYLLVHDGRKPIRSIRSQLRKRNTIKYLSTACELVAGLQITMVLIQAGSSGAKFLPMCRDPLKWYVHDMDFGDWWEEPVFRASNGDPYSRREDCFP